MTISISIYDIISWLFTVISIMLFLFERKKNSRLPYYMAVQGVLRACSTKAGFYSSHASQLKNRGNKKNTSVSSNEYILFADTVASDYLALMEHIMGSLKTIEPEKDMPFDAMAFTQNKNFDNTK